MLLNEGDDGANGPLFVLRGVGRRGGAIPLQQVGVVAMDDQRMGDAANEMGNGAGAKLKETLGRAGDTVAAVE